MKIEKNVPLAPLTTLQVGGAARFFSVAANVDELVAAAGFADADGLPVFFLGGGSNVLIADGGFDGLVVQVAVKGIDPVPDSSNSISVGAGELWDGFVSYCVENALAGVECLSGIPGFVGSTPIQNVGAYGQDVSETIVSVKCFERSSGRVVTLSNGECGFEYRTSIFNSSMRDRYVVLSATFALEPGGRPKIAYKDLVDRFGDREPTLAEVRTAVLEIRRAKSMVIDPADPNSRSAGSFFKNPIVDRPTLEQVRAAAGGEVPIFPAGGDSVKIPAAWLIERAGFRKGYRKGKAGISANHSLAIVNYGGASAAEIVDLKNEITESVGEKFGVVLIPEPVFVGF